MSSHLFIFACVCLLGLNAVCPQEVNAQDSREERSRQLPADPSPLAALTKTVSTLFGPPLAEAIRSTRDRLYPHGRPMPAELRQKLAPFFPRTMLEKVRYSTEWDPTRDTLPSLFMGSSTKSAMTLGDVILFRDAQGAADPLLWAHELTHVMQYQQLGIPAFATRYLEQGWELEAEAMAKADAIGRQLAH
jgi:uncharacterized protein DUF4157